MATNPAASWAKLGITRKLWLVFGVLFTILSLAGGAAFVGLTVVRGAEVNILANMEIRAKILEMEGLLEKSRRLYRDFVLYLPEMDFTAAREQYCQPSQALAARVIAVCEELKRLVGDLPAAGAVAKRNVDITLFTSTAKRYSQTLVNQTELLATLYEPNSGLLQQLSDTVTKLGGTLADAPGAALLLRELDILEKRYEITRQRPYMQAALNKVDTLRRMLDGDAAVSEGTRARALEALGDYEATAARILDAVAAFRANINDFNLQAQAVDPISNELKALSAAEVAAARKRIQWASQLALGIMAVAFSLGLVCLLVAGRVLHASITGKIVSMTSHAAAIRAGHLGEMLANGSGDELGVLAATFNAMTKRIRDLVETLEEKVRQRTQELADKNRELDAKNQALATLSLTDRLTGLCNRRKLDQTLAAELRRARRYGSVFSVVMVDLDHFKDINDTFGHGVGDTVLVRAADILVCATRETDLVGRWGGEEFLIVCPETDGNEARRMAEHLRREFEETVIPDIGRVTASFGLAAFAVDKRPGDIVERADAAMYRAKQAGRNRVAVDGDV